MDIENTSSTEKAATGAVLKGVPMHNALRVLKKIHVVGFYLEGGLYRNKYNEESGNVLNCFASKNSNCHKQLTCLISFNRKCSTEKRARDALN